MRRWIMGELAANAVWLAALTVVLPCGALSYHLLAMAIGQCLTAFFAVWTVHHGCSEHGALAVNEPAGPLWHTRVQPQCG